MVSEKFIGEHIQVIIIDETTGKACDHKSVDSTTFGCGGKLEEILTCNGCGCKTTTEKS
jgi:hypothetical protein